MSEEEEILNNWFASKHPILKKLRNNMGFSAEEVLSIIKYSIQSKDQQIKDLTELLKAADDVIEDVEVFPSSPPKSPEWFYKEVRYCWHTGFFHCHGSLHTTRDNVKKWIRENHKNIKNK